MRKSVVSRESLAPSGGGRMRQGGQLHFLEGCNVKDTRNFKDKHIFSQAAHSLLNYLEENGFPHAVTIRNLEQPTTAMVTQIFKFLTAKISSHHEIGQGRLDEEFPKIMADLYYPYTLKKSHVQSATTPSGWPVIFGALHWLYENLGAINEDVKRCDSKHWRDYYWKLYEGFLYQRPVSDKAVETMRRTLADDAKIRNAKEVQAETRVESLRGRISELDTQDAELNNRQSKINENKNEINLIKREIINKREELASKEQEAKQSAKRLVDAEAECRELCEALNKLKDAVSKQPVDKNVITATRDAVQRLKLDIGDAEHEIAHYDMLIEETIEMIQSAKAPVEEMLVPFRSEVNQLLSQLNRLSISVDPENLGLSLPSNPAEQLQSFKNVIKSTLLEVADAVAEVTADTKQKMREFYAKEAELNCDNDHIDRDLNFMDSQMKRLIEEERQLMEREEKRLYEWRSQAEEKAAKRRARIAELDARNADVRNRISTIDLEIENSNMVLVDRSRTYEQALIHISSTASEAYKSVTENLLRLLTSIRESQKREKETLRRAFELAHGHPFLRQCLLEVLAQKKASAENNDGH